MECEADAGPTVEVAEVGDAAERESGQEDDQNPGQSHHPHSSGELHVLNDSDKDNYMKTVVVIMMVIIRLMMMMMMMMMMMYDDDDDDD